MIEISTFANSKYISAASLTRQRSAAATYLRNVTQHNKRKSTIGLTTQSDKIDIKQE